MGKPDFLGNWCFYNLPRQAFRLKRCQNRRMGYGYVWGQKVSGESFGQKNGEIQVCCLEKPYGITELQDFEWLEDILFYTEVFNPEVVSKKKFFLNRKWLWQYLENLNFMF